MLLSIKCCILQVNFTALCIIKLSVRNFYKKIHVKQSIPTVS